MAYIVRVEVGKGKNKAITQSIPLPSKKRVCNYIRRNPLVRSNTQVKVTNTRNKKTLIGNQSTFCSRRLRK